MSQPYWATKFCTSTRTRQLWSFWTRQRHQWACRCQKTTVTLCWRFGHGARAGTGQHTRLSCPRIQGLVWWCRRMPPPHCPVPMPTSSQAWLCSFLWWCQACDLGKSELFLIGGLKLMLPFMDRWVWVQGWETRGFTFNNDKDLFKNVWRRYYVCVLVSV